VRALKVFDCLGAKRLNIDKNLSMLEAATLGVRELAPAFAAGNLLPARVGPPWASTARLAKSGTKVPHSKALRASNIFRRRLGKCVDHYEARNVNFVLVSRTRHRSGESPRRLVAQARHEACLYKGTSRAEPLAS
jgi:hypothetical protein